MKDFRGRAILLTQDALIATAALLGVSIAEIMTIIDVETCGVGFLPDARPVILFERHIFSRRTGGKHDDKFSDISSPKAGGYGGYGAPQYDRLYRAMALDEQMALMSASWGLGQIMGFNYESAGYASVESMVHAFCDSEDEQLLAVARFIQKAGLAKPLQNHDWKYFASKYNGPAYDKNNYDTRLAQSYNRWTKLPPTDCMVRAQQVNLAHMGYYKSRIDGIEGPKTRAALQLAMRDGKVPYLA